jgi:hypothetical protein
MTKTAVQHNCPRPIPESVTCWLDSPYPNDFVWANGHKIEFMNPPVTNRDMLAAMQYMAITSIEEEEEEEYKSPSPKKRVRFIKINGKSYKRRHHPYY